MIGSECQVLFGPYGSSQDLSRLVSPVGCIRVELTGRDTLPTDWQPALLRLLLQTLAFSLSPTNPKTFQGGNTIVIRKLFGSVRLGLLTSVNGVKWLTR